jgi:hypothetical protein
MLPTNCKVMLDGLQGEFVDLAECWTRRLAREEELQTWRGRDGCELRPEAEARGGFAERASRFLTSPVVVMREGGVEDEGGGARKAVL